MRRVRSEHTKPEVLVRKIVSSMGFRYRLHSDKISGHPDLAFSRLHKVIFVHGCFWHGHWCPAGTLPASNTDYWNAKRIRNLAREKRTRLALLRTGWESLGKLSGY